MTHTEEFLELDGGRVHLLRAGSGEPVLFLHAAGGAGEWNDFLQLLSEHYDVIAPDHPGFGKSDDFPELTAIDDLAYHYLDVLDALELEMPHVVGASFGGWIAAELAVHSPHRIGTLTLLSAAGLRVPGHPVPDIFLMPPARLVETLFHTLPPLPAPPTVLDAEAVLAAYRDATALARFSWVPYLHDPKLERRLRRITAPTLVAAPAGDRLIPTAHARLFSTRIGGSLFQLVPDCGHAMRRLARPPVAVIRPPRRARHDHGSRPARLTPLVTHDLGKALVCLASASPPAPDTPRLGRGC